MATLAEWGLESLVDDARLVVSELTTNAVTASTRPGLDPHDRFLRFLGLRLTDLGRRLVVEVFDAAPGLPTVRPDDPLAEGGHGLRLVAALATWGVYATKSGAGKVVWAAFEHEESRSARAGVLGALPRRSPATPDAAPTVDKDLELLGRVRQGLSALTFTGGGAP
jgi:hypothetical protein